ncbi:MAG: EAL domain-containing protein [Janthinobacterium lividum]
MRHLGVGIALDDFGTGYSSFSHVHHLQPDVIKVDRSFVAGLHDSKLSRDILRTILDLSRNIGARCIVEGIETVEQRQHLTALGCQLMQGFLLGRPTTDVVDMLRLYDQALPIAHSPASSTGGTEVAMARD